MVGTDWATRAGDALVDLGSPLNEAGSVPNGSGNGGTHIGGYSIMQAESVDAVNTLLEGHPQLHGPGRVDRSPGVSADPRDGRIAHALL